jgi:hypothetical protein
MVSGSENRKLNNHKSERWQIEHLKHDLPGVLVSFRMRNWALSQQEKVISE